MPRSRLSVSAAIAAAAIVLVSVAPATAAYAEGPLVFDAPPVEYGTQWQLETTDPSIPNGYGPWTSSVAMRGAPDGYQPSGYFMSPNYGEPGASGFIFPDGTRRPLAPGTYEIDFAANSPYAGTYGTATPIKLVIKPAALAIETRALADTADPSSVIVTVRFTGDFVDTFETTTIPFGPLTPAGSWMIAITDDAGESTETTIERDADSDVLAASFLWSGSQPGKQYTVTTKFAPSGASAGYFAIATSSSFSFTAPQSARAFTKSEAVDPLPLAPQKVAVFSVPIWWAILAGLVLAALVALTIVFTVKLARSAAPSTRKASANV